MGEAGAVGNVDHLPIQPLRKSIDPIQGAEAYEEALQAAGNPDYHVELIPGVGHTMHHQLTDCPGDPGTGLSERYTDLIEEWATKLAAMLAE